MVNVVSEKMLFAVETREKPTVSKARRNGKPFLRRSETQELLCSCQALNVQYLIDKGTETSRTEVLLCCVM